MQPSITKRVEDKDELQSQCGISWNQSCQHGVFQETKHFSLLWMFILFIQGESDLPYQIYSE